MQIGKKVPRELFCGLLHSRLRWQDSGPIAPHYCQGWAQMNRLSAAIEAPSALRRRPDSKGERTLNPTSGQSPANGFDQSHASRSSSLSLLLDFVRQVNQQTKLMTNSQIISCQRMQVYFPNLHGLTCPTQGQVPRC